MAGNPACNKPFACLSIRRSALVVTVPVSVDWLLPVTGSTVVPLTVAVFATVPVVAEATSTVIAICGADAPTARSWLYVQITTFASTPVPTRARRPVGSAARTHERGAARDRIAHGDRCPGHRRPEVGHVEGVRGRGAGEQGACPALENAEVGLRPDRHHIEIGVVRRCEFECLRRDRGVVPQCRSESQCRWESDRDRDQLELRTRCQGLDRVARTQPTLVTPAGAPLAEYMSNPVRWPRRA